MTYGLLAALAWGVGLLGAAMAARRIGAFPTLIVGEGAAMLAYGAIWWSGHFSMGAVGPSLWPLIAAGVFGVGGYLALYRGLESGHVGLVSAISASYAGVIVILSVLLLGERLSAAAGTGVVLTIAGVGVASSRGTAGGARTARVAGLSFGLISALFYAVSGFLIGRYAQPLGWLVPVVIARSAAMTVLLGILAARLARAARPAGRAPVRGLAWAVGAGLADAAGLIFFTRGDQVGTMAITAAVSSAYPVVPLIGGLVLLRERLARRQVGGAALILTGLILLGLGS